MPASASDRATLACAGVARWRARVAQYYQARLVLVDEQVLEWPLDGPVRRALQGACQVAVNAHQGLAVDSHGQLLRWTLGRSDLESLLGQVALVAAGDSGLLAIRTDGSLWSLPAQPGSEWLLEAPVASHAWVGDGADYFVDAEGGLHVRGLAHRGQYGNGSLVSAEGWIQVAQDALQVVAHTGHALYLRRDGQVLGTGGNRFGPLGVHGHGDKADQWGPVFEGATCIATGSRHSLAIDGRGGLWVWGAGAGLAPQRVMEDVVAVDGGDSDSTVLCADGSVWAFTPGEAPWRLPMPG